VAAEQHDALRALAAKALTVRFSPLFLIPNSEEPLLRLAETVLILEFLLRTLKILLHWLLYGLLHWLLHLRWCGYSHNVPVPARPRVRERLLAVMKLSAHLASILPLKVHFIINKLLTGFWGFGEQYATERVDGQKTLTYCYN